MSKSLQQVNRKSPHFLGTLRSELLTCAICLDTLDCPRSLPCLHSFCQKCLIQTFSTSTNESSCLAMKRTFNCPTCRRSTNIPPGNDVHEFPRDFKTVKLLECFNSFAIHASAFVCGFCDEDRANLWQCNTCDDRFCHICLKELHSGKPFENHLTFRIWQPTDLNLCRSHQKSTTHFCTTCNHFLCVICMQEHAAQHEISETHVAVSKQQQLLTKHLKQLQKRHVDVTESLFQVIRNESKIRDMNEETKNDIQVHCKDLIKAIQDREHQLLDIIGQEANQCSGQFLKMKKQLQSQLTSIERLISEATALLMYPDAKQKLEFSDSILNKCREVASARKVSLDTQIRDAKCVTFSAGHGLDVGILTEIRIAIDARNSSANEAMDEMNVNTSVSNQKSFIVERDRRRVSRQLTRHGCERKSAAQSGLAKNCNVDKPSESLNHSGLYINREPTKRRSVKKCARLACVIQGYGHNSGQLDTPFYASFNDKSEIIVGELGNRRLQAFSMDGKHLYCLLEGQILPRCIIAEPLSGNLVVADELTKSLKLIDLSTGTTTTLPLESVSYPYGVEILKNGDFIVSDKIFGTLTILSNDGSRLNAIGTVDKTKDTFLNPSFLQVSDEERIYVTDTGNHEVKVYDKDGRLHAKFGEWGIGEGQFRYPSGIALSGDLLIIADTGNDRIIQMTKDGVHLGTLLDKSTDIYQPVCVCVDKTGTQMAVTLPSRHEVRIYELSSSIPVTKTTKHSSF